MFPVGGLWLFFTSHGCYRSSFQELLTHTHKKKEIKKKKEREKGRLFGKFRIECSCNQKKILH